MKNVTLKQYTLGTFRHIASSQFIYEHLGDIIELKSLTIKIPTRKYKKIHYFYLWLLTKKRPYLQKSYPSFSSSKKSKNIFLKTKTKNYSLNVMISSKNTFHMLYEILMQMISKQTHSEKKVWTFQQHLVYAMIFSAPLTKATLLLQMKNTYFPTIPIHFGFCFSKTTAFQKLFFLRALKILSSITKIPALDIFREDTL
jgi:hypothetical protein